MVSLFATTQRDGPCGSFTDALRSHPDIEVVGIGANGREVLEAIRSTSVDAVLFDEVYADLARTIRLSAEIPLNSSPTMVLAAENVTRPIIVKSIACGFDGVVSITDELRLAAKRLTDIVNGDERLVDEPLLAELQYTPGLLVRQLVSAGPIDREVMDLVGAGLNDEAISGTLKISIQEVRNRIEGLLTSNGLSSRTHLAVARASHVVIPDFT
jgi:DNA-binding NarL/FixJ family response regulator